MIACRLFCMLVLTNVSDNKTERQDRLSRLYAQRSFISSG